MDEPFRKTAIETANTASKFTRQTIPEDYLNAHHLFQIKQNYFRLFFLIIDNVSDRHSNEIWANNAQQ